MNMDELLESIWSAEELLSTTSNSGNGGNGSIQTANNIQRQGSLTLPRTLSQKRVEEVWQDLLKDSFEKDDFNKGEFHALQNQPTLGEITLEEFLFRAGVVREDPQPIGRPSNGLKVDFQSVNSDSGLGFSFRPQSQSSSFLSNQITNQPPNIPLNVRNSHQQPPLLPKSVTATNFASNITTVNSNQLGSPASRHTTVVSDSVVKNGIVRFNGLADGGVSLLRLETKGVIVPTGSPANQFSPDMSSRSSVDRRGRKSNGALEKVVERRQRRMIKNRESAAKSRARKQASMSMPSIAGLGLTLQCDVDHGIFCDACEIEKLKELNRDCRRNRMSC